MAKPGQSDAEAWRPAPGPWGPADLAAVLVWTAAVAAFFWDVVSFRKALFYFDITEINYPYREFFASELRLGRFSRWCPGLYCGLPLYSESQAGYLHPLKYLLYPWLATWKAFNLDTVLSVWLTGLGTFGWLRRHVGARGALTGGVVFGLSGFVWAHLIHTSMTNALASVPFVVWATEWAWDRGRLAGVALGGLALAVQVFAGHLQDTLLTALLLGLYTLFRAATERGSHDRLRVLAVASGVVGLGVALSAVQWVPSKELLDRSPRAGGLTYGDLIYGSWSPELLPTLVVREAFGTRARDTDWLDGFYPYHEMNAYLGLTALALVVIGGAAYRDRWVAFWVVLAGAAAILMLGKHTFLFDLAHKVPVLGSSRIPVRFHLYLSLAVAALTAVGVDRLEQGVTVRLRGAAVLVAVLVLGSVPVLVYDYAPVFTQPTRWRRPDHLVRFGWLGRELAVAAVRTLAVGLAGSAAVVVARRARTAGMRRAACWVLPVVVTADLLGSHWSDVPTVDPAYWTSPPPAARLLRADPSFVRMATVRTFAIGERSAGEPGYASEPIEFFSARDTLCWSLPVAWGLRSAGGETPIIPRRMLEWTDHGRVGEGRFDVDSVTHLTASRQTVINLGRPEPAGSANVYRNPGALPRARVMGRPYYAANESEAVAAVDRLGPAIRERLVVEDPDRPLGPEASPGSARFLRDDPEHVVVETEAERPAYLVLADTYDPGWSATVDGRPAPVRPAWIAFRAVLVPAGRHEVVFRYSPKGFREGLAVSLAGTAVALVLLAWPRPREVATRAHSELGWGGRWPLWGGLVLAAVVAASVVKVDASGRPGLSARWEGSFHPFTWGSGYEAIRPRAPR